MRSLQVDGSQLLYFKPGEVYHVALSPKQAAFLMQEFSNEVAINSVKLKLLKMIEGASHTIAHNFGAEIFNALQAAELSGYKIDLEPNAPSANGIIKKFRDIRKSR